MHKLSRVGFKTADSILLNLEQQNIDNPDKFKFKFDYDLNILSKDKSLGWENRCRKKGLFGKEFQFILELR